VGSRSFEPDALGWSRAGVFRLTAPGRSTLWLKTQAVGVDRPIADERDRLAWIAGRLPAPEIVAWAEEGGREFLVTSDIPGVPASAPGDARAVACIVGKAIRRIHDMPVAACPFDKGIATALAESRRNIERSWIDEEDIAREHPGRTATDLLAEAERTRPQERDLVFTHGDACIPNFLVDGAHLGGIVDWGNAGAGDPWRDLALATRSLVWNHGPSFEEELLAAYGAASADHERMRWWRLVDELW
jgi:aminoglycoside 3'-phosphotransferase-2